MAGGTWVHRAIHAAVLSAGDTVEAASREQRERPQQELGTEMQSKGAGLKGPAPLVVAAGGESTA